MEPSVVVTNAHSSRGSDEEALAQLIRRVVDEEGATLDFIGLVLCDHARLRALNRSHLGHDYDTDVLSFPLTEDEGVVDGEIYVDLDTAAERHEEFDSSYDEEVRRYVVHGVLHLLGYDDRTTEAKEAMHRREDRYVGGAP